MSGLSQAIASVGAALCPASAPGVRVSRFWALVLPSLGVATFAVALLHVLFLSDGTRVLFRDSDAGWHIRVGEAILTGGSVPRADTFSYTRAGREWLAWEWLSDALLGAAHLAAGPAGVALLAALAIALAAWGALRLALSLGANFFLAAASIVLLLGTTSIHWLARPHVFSWLLALAFVAVAEHQRVGAATLRERGLREGGRERAALPSCACCLRSPACGPTCTAVSCLGPASSLSTRLANGWPAQCAVRSAECGMGHSALLPRSALWQRRLRRCWPPSLILTGGNSTATWWATCETRT